MKAIILAVMLALFAFPAFADAIDVNNADAETLATLDGVGDVKAEAIVAHRAEHGPFRSLEDLANVKGIGSMIIDKNRDRISLGETMETAGGE